MLFIPCAVRKLKGYCIHSIQSNNKSLDDCSSISKGCTLNAQISDNPVLAFLYWVCKSHVFLLGSTTFKGKNEQILQLVQEFIAA